MNFFEALEWSNWKNLSQELRVQVMNQVLMYFVSPLKKISDVQAVKFELGGVKCDTFECSIDEERFVLVPGNQEAILGWDIGVQGLTTTCWDQSPKSSSEVFQKLKKNYQFETTDDWDTFINESTSPLRKAAIAPMLVQKEALPIGTKRLGKYNLITGEFTGEIELFQEIRLKFLDYLQQPKTLEESLTYALPIEIFSKQNFYAQLDTENENYIVYSHKEQTLNSYKEQVHNEVFDLLSENDWEYVVGAGTRKLFRWGNDIEEDQTYYGRQVTRWMRRENMFGLIIDTSRKRWEVTEEGFLKLEKMTLIEHPLYDHLPLASYYRSRKIIKKDQPLTPGDYLIRKAIFICQE